jgi:hypothetical protein
MIASLEVVLGCCVAVTVFMFGMLIGSIIDKTELRKEKKERDKYPEYYTEKDQIEQMRRKASLFYKIKIYDLKKEIDGALENIKYYPAEDREVKESGIEELRIKYRDNVREYDRMMYEIKTKETKLSLKKKDG